MKVKNLPATFYINGHPVSPDEMFNGGPPQRILECQCDYCVAMRKLKPGERVTEELIKTRIIGAPTVAPKN